MLQSIENQKELHILVTGAAGKLAQAFVPLLMTGGIFTPDVQISLNLMDIPEKVNLLKGIAYELEDCNFNNLKAVNYGSDEKRLFANVEIAIFMGGQSRLPGMERSDLLEINANIFKEQGKIMNEFAKKDCKIVVVANPVNTNATILQQSCPKIPQENFTCLNLLDRNRARNYLSKQLKCKPKEVKNIIIWGNHSQTLYPDITFCKIQDKNITKVLPNDFCNEEFVKAIQKRGNQILEAKQQTAVTSGAYALAEHLKEWVQGSPNINEWTCMGVISDGTCYDIPKGIAISLPVICKPFCKYEIIKGLELTETTQEKIKCTVKELIGEIKYANEQEYLS